MAGSGNNYSSSSSPHLVVHNINMVSRESAMQSLSSIIQLHFDRTLEKKRLIDKQKQHLFRLFHLLFLFLALLLSSSRPQQCRHCWIPIGLLSLAHVTFYASLAHTLRCLNALKYQRRCHKLTLALATDRMKHLVNAGEATVPEADFEICYQEPPERYLGKFKRARAMYFAFLVSIFAFTVSASVVVLCF